MTDLRRDMPMALSLSSCRRMLSMLLTALLLVQTVGVLHRVAHAQQSVGVVSDAALVAVKGDLNLFAAIWGDHSNSAECQLFDQTCPDMLHAPAWNLSTASVNPMWTTSLLLERFALFERFYAARGPPADLL